LSQFLQYFVLFGTWYKFVLKYVFVGLVGFAKTAPTLRGGKRRIHRNVICKSANFFGKLRSPLPCGLKR